MLRDFLFQFYDEILSFSYLVLGFGLFQNLIYLLQLPLAALELRKINLRKKEDNRWNLIKSEIALPISIIIPAYNEELTIYETVLSALSTQYPSFELIVVNDGSKDDTLAVLIEKFSLKQTDRFYESQLPHREIKATYTSFLYPNLLVVDKVNGGKSDAVNAGIDISRNPLFCTIDADSLLDPSALLASVQPFIEEPEKMMASGGTVRIINGSIVEDGAITKLRLPRKILPLLQVIEYVRAFLMGRIAWSHIEIVTIISGAFAIFKRDIAITVGGFNTKTIGEDFELVIKIHRHCRENKIDYEMRFVPEPVCWTEVPENLRALKKQRIRWQQGALEVLFNNVGMLFNPKYGRIGMLAFPLMFVVDVLCPILEFLSYILFPIFYFCGILNIEFMLIFFSLFFVFGIFISVMSLVLEEMSLRRFSHVKDLVIMGFIAIIENFGYRQLNSLWRIMGWWRFITKKQDWGEMMRVGSKSLQQ